MHTKLPKYEQLVLGFPQSSLQLFALTCITPRVKMNEIPKTIFFIRLKI